MATPTMGYVFGSLAAAQSAQSSVDAQLGYPKAGHNVGSGVHVGGTTTHEADVIAHPSGTQWALFQDAAVASAAGSAGLPAASPLDTTWFPAPPASGVSTASLKAAAVSVGVKL